MAAAQGSNEIGRRQRSEKVRRSWSAEEEEALLVCLKDLVVNGWKSDNGFRAGYINKLEIAMRVLFPRANIKSTPHIISKLTGWKKNYGSLSYILSRSGVGFNLHGDYKVDCGNEQWDQICSVDSNAKNIRGKSWPYLDRWTEIFGKDRATGEAAEDVVDAVNQLINEDNHVAMEHVQEEITVDMQDIPQTPGEADSITQSSRRDVGCSRSSKKRKASDDMDQKLCDLLGQMQQDTNSRLESISSRIGHQADMGKARKEIWMLLEDISIISEDERFDICDILLDNPERLEFFTTLPVAARPTFVRRLLNGKAI